MNMEITIDEEVKEEIDYIIRNFAKKFADEVNHVESLAFCLQTLIDGLEAIENETSD